MKWIKRIGLVLLLAIGLLAIGGYLFVQNLKPQYSGSLTLEGLKEEVTVYFDTYGIPHIYAQSEEDAQFALGYIHAQDRLFQMEMIRRLAKGELAEILGLDLLNTDRFFRTIGLTEYAKKEVTTFNAKPENDPMKKAALAYYAGLNSFIEKGPTPIEFRLLGIPKKAFTIEDTYAIYGYMAFSFAQAFRTDPLLTKIKDQWGIDYLNDLDVHWHPGAQTIPVYGRSNKEDVLSARFGIQELFESFPVAPWIGSNSWVLGPQKTSTGKVLFSNDTHMQFSQPSVWYEAHLEYPGNRIYGSYLAGVPFATLGHNDHHAIGLTMLENDDIDFYLEQANPDNPNQVRFKDNWENLTSRTEVIKVKGEEDFMVEVKCSRHGPIMNEALEQIGKMTDQPVSMWWIFTALPLKSLESSYQMVRAQSIDKVREAVSWGHAPGLNVMYGDVEGNIAWWAYGKLPKRPEHVNSKLFLDGSSGLDEIQGFYPFEENPQSENPPSGFVYSANNQPDTTNGVLHPGYYIPEDRARRIVNLLEEDRKWSLEDMKTMINDVQSPIMPKVAKELVSAIQLNQPSELASKALTILGEWDGDNQLTAIAPTIYTKLMYYIAEGVFQDELGEEGFKTFLSTHIIKRTLPILISNPDANWWDDQGTSDTSESRSDIITKAFQKTIADLENQFGPVLEQWTWDKAHTIEHGHALAQGGPALRSFFNVGPFPINGNTEVINNQQFRLTPDGLYKVTGGPAKRRIIDFSDIERSYNVLPTGQSGNPFSKHYADQANMFVEGQFRLQQMNKSDIKATGRKLVMKASK